MITVFWAYEGWQFVTYSAGEAVNPKRDFPRAMFSGVVFLIGVYLLANLGYLAALGPEKVGRSETIAAASISAVLGPGAAKIVALTILISVFSATNSVVLTAPRVFYAMANDGLFFRRLADVHPRFRTPATAVIVLGIWSIFLAWLGKFQELIGYAMFVAWIFYGLAAAAVFVRKAALEGLVPQAIATAFDLTPAELRVLLAIFEFGGIPQAARPVFCSI